MKVKATCFLAASCILLIIATIVPAVAQQTTDITASPSSLSFGNEYVGLATASQVLTITNQLDGQITIDTMTFSCTGGFGISSGIAPFELGTVQTITHYSVYFQPTAAQTYNCNFQLNLSDGTYLDVPVSGTGLTSTAIASISPSSLTFSNQQVGNLSAPQTVTITNTGTGALTLSAITLTPPDFSTNNITLPYTINPGASLPVSVYYQPTQAISETGAIDFSYASLPDSGAALNGNGVTATKVSIASLPTMQPATQKAAYEATLSTSGGVGPFTWALASGSTLPSGLTLSSAGVISGTLGSSVTATTYYFTVQVTDTSDGATASSAMNLAVATNLGDNCNDLSFDIPGTSSPLVAITDLGTGTFEGDEGGLYPNGSNVRPSTQNSAGIAIAQGIVPLNSSGTYSPTGQIVVLAVGESTEQNEFNRFMPIANSDPTKNPYVLLVNGAQGGATPYNFTSTTSAYWSTVVNNYLPQNGVTADQVQVAILEDTDGISTGTFPTDISTLQTEYQEMMNTMLTLFPNLKLVYFSSRVYGGYSNDVGHPDNPEPYAYEVGWAVKWVIQDQIDGAANLNYNPANGPVEAPWMSWGPYYWANGMLGSDDGLVWDCADFASDGTHPSSTYGQLKTSSALLEFLKTDQTTIPWYLAPVYGLTVNGGSGQSGAPGTTLPTPLTVLASNINGGAGISGVSVGFSDGGAGGSFSPTSATTNSSGIASTNYTLPSTAKSITVTATSSGYQSTTFTETSAAEILSATGGNNQTGAPGTTLPTPLTVTAMNNGSAQSGVSVTFTDNGAGGTFSPLSGTTGSNGQVSTTYTLSSTAKTANISATSSGYVAASFTETGAVLTLTCTGGNGQTGSTGTTLPIAITMTATDNGNPASGVNVTFSDGGAGGSFSAATVSTNSSGNASSAYTLPGTAKTVTITGSAPGYSSSTCTETSTAEALAATGGNNQNGTVSTTLPTALSVTATNNGTAVSGASVTFSDNGAGGKFSLNPVTTNSSGIASTSYTLPATAETITISATSPGFTPASFTETSQPTVTALTITSGGKQTGTVGTALPKAIAVNAKDGTVNVKSASVFFTDGSTGTFNPNPAVTGLTGATSTTYTLPTTAGTYTVTASVGTVTVKTTETAVAGAQSSFTIVTGNNQSANPDTKLPKNLEVKLTDVYGNPIKSVTVTFTDNNAGGTFTTTDPVTNSSGEATTTYTTGSTAGTITISATTSVLGPLNFTETVK
jgi:hypothetical protein